MYNERMSMLVKAKAMQEERFQVRGIKCSKVFLYALADTAVDRNQVPEESGCTELFSKKSSVRNARCTHEVR